MQPVGLDPDRSRGALAQGAAVLGSATLRPNQHEDGARHQRPSQSAEEGCRVRGRTSYSDGPFPLPSIYRRIPPSRARRRRLAQAICSGSIASRGNESKSPLLSSGITSIPPDRNRLSEASEEEPAAAGRRLVVAVLVGPPADGSGARARRSSRSTASAISLSQPPTPSPTRRTKPLRRSFSAVNSTENKEETEGKPRLQAASRTLIDLLQH